MHKHIDESRAYGKREKARGGGGGGGGGLGVCSRNSVQYIIAFI